MFQHLSTLYSLVYITARIGEQLINVVLTSQVADKTRMNSKHTGKNYCNSLTSAFSLYGKYCGENDMIFFLTLRLEKLSDDGKYTD
jgi:hypothetical protein